MLVHELLSSHTKSFHRLCFTGPFPPRTFFLCFSPPKTLPLYYKLIYFVTIIDVIDFDELSDPAALTKFLEEYKKLPKEQKDLLANISTLITSMSKAEIRDMSDAMLEKMTVSMVAWTVVVM